MKRSPLRKVSKKRAAELKEYSRLRAEFLIDNPWCYIGMDINRPGCDQRSFDVHHIRGRGKMLNDTNHWLPVCRPCHDWIENNKREARQLGYITYK